MSDNVPSLTDLNPDQLRELLDGLGAPAYRMQQLLQWLYRDLAWSYDEVVNIPRALRQKLAGQARLHSLKAIQELTSRDGTVKVLFELADGKTVESAFMPYEGGHSTVCVSTQIGCPIGCPFCATGQQGFERNLTPGEMIDQVLYFARQLKDRAAEGSAAPITNLVFMGMGEPLANYKNLWSAIEWLNAPDGFGLGARGMTISTAGLVPQIKRLARERLQVGLAVSLHAPTNGLRSKLVPVNARYPLEEMIPACREYAEVSGRRVSFEYILFAGYNDTARQALSLARLLKGVNCHVNLIAANRTELFRFEAPALADLLSFEKQLRELGVTCTIRRGRGMDIAGGCGQLRSRSLKAAA